MSAGAGAGGGAGMVALQAACAAIVALYAAVRLARARRRARVARVAWRLALLAVAGWVAEDTVIRAYGFYGYAARWAAKIDRAPLLIALIWPVVVDSAAVLAGALAGGGGRRARVPVVAAAIVLADAALIEPIAVRAGLWSWTEPGVFAVPPIGVLGWGLFAWAAVAWIERVDARGKGAAADALVVGIAPAATHALLLVAWWAALRWASRALAPWPLVAAAWVGSLALAVAASRRRAGVPLADLLVRLPGAAVFFVLLALTPRGAAPLVAWTLAFVPPYLALALRTARPSPAPAPAPAPAPPPAIRPA